MIYLLYTLHIIICIFLILVVLLQQGKGADLSVFGGGTTMAAFGARSATNLLHRMTVGGFVAFSSAAKTSPMPMPKVGVGMASTPAATPAAAPADTTPPPAAPSDTQAPAPQTPNQQ